MRLRLRAFGVTFCSVTFDAGPLLELLEEDDGITGGGTVYLERDGDPIVPEERHNHEYDRRLGFQC